MLKRIFHRNHIYLTIISVVLMWTLGQLVRNISFFNPVSRAVKNFAISDIYYQMMKDGGYSQPSDIITIIDATSLYDRSKIGDMMLQVSSLEPAVVGIDCIYEGFRGDTIGTNRLAEGLFSLPNPVVAFKLTNYNPETGEFTQQRHSFFAPMDGIGEGYSNVSYDAGGITVRSLVTQRIVNGDTLLSLPYQIGSAYTDDVKDMASTRPYMIDYTPTDFPVVHCDSILQNADKIRGRIVIIGATHDDADMHSSPYGRIPGTVIQAYILQTLLEHEPVKEVPVAWTVIISLFFIWLTDVIKPNCRISVRSKNAHSCDSFSRLHSQRISLISSGLIFLYISISWCLIFSLFISTPRLCCGASHCSWKQDYSITLHVRR